SGGISQRGLAMETELITEQRLMRVNFWGTVALSKWVIPGMIAQGAGQIVCISSLVGKFGTRYRSAYAASKHAIHGYFDSLRTEVFDKGINITIICPGFIRTNVSINALNSRGEKQGTMDDAQAHGMSPEKFAKIAVSDILSLKEESYIGGKEKLGVLLKRFVPGIFSKILRKAKVV
ncbi:MAG: SDR family NAD(P)-dependent oxidoreductase, partial [Chitinophagaceae bacterium]